MVLNAWMTVRDSCSGSAIVERGVGRLQCLGRVAAMGEVLRQFRERRGLLRAPAGEARDRPPADLHCVLETVVHIESRGEPGERARRPLAIPERLKQADRALKPLTGSHTVRVCLGCVPGLVKQRRAGRVVPGKPGGVLERALRLGS